MAGSVPVKLHTGLFGVLEVFEVAGESWPMAAKA